MKAFMVFVAALCLYGRVSGQAKPGDIVPDINLSTIIYQPVSNSRLYQFKNKVLLIDFWATNCSSCIKEIKVLDSVQKYEAGLSLLLVNSVMSDTKEKVERLFKRINLSIQQPVILGDSLLNNLFPHKFVPHFVWLDSSFKVIAVTDDVDLKNLKGLLDNKEVFFDQFVDMSHFQRDSLLFVNHNGGDGSAVLARSTISGPVPGLGLTTWIKRDSNSKVSKILLTNQPILELLRRAYNYFEYPGRIEGAIPAATPYCYELITPAVPYDSARILMQEDINRYFGLTAELKNIPTACYVLKNIGVTRNRYDMESLTEFFNRSLDKPVVNEASNEGKNSINLTGVPLLNIQQLQTNS
jgi:thiol-disulfide isomerase/thioredoxin